MTIKGDDGNRTTVTGPYPGAEPLDLGYVTFEPSDWFVADQLDGRAASTYSLTESEITGLAMNTVEAERVARVRAFNRFYTGVIGTLNDAYLRTRWNVSEARVLFEIATRGEADSAALRHDLGIDSGYLSRILARFESEHLVERRRSAADGRRQVVVLTPAGRKEFGQLNRRSARDIRALLARHSDRDQRRLLQAMDVIERALDADPGSPAPVLRAPSAGEFGWVIERHGALYREEYGWDQSFEALVARIVADFLERHDPGREAAWIGEAGGAAAGCVFCVRRDDETAQLRLLLVEPHVRGMGLGSMLVNRCIDFARDSGYRSLVLWTNDVLVDARRLYERAGFKLIEEERHHSFGADLVGQNWALDLTDR